MFSFPFRTAVFAQNLAAQDGTHVNYSRLKGKKMSLVYLEHSLRNIVKFLNPKLLCVCI